MYKIRGADNREYGPVTTDVLRQWIADRRVNGQTMIQAEGSTEWRPAASFPEFASSLAAQPTAPPPPPRVPLSTGPAPSPSSSVRPSSAPTMSGMAIASLILGILGVFCGIT